ncbi:MAG TPA: sulfotransferase [Rhodanobacteraceae bacterium]|nr:sulfotransferase [Rhodanobacteraceae bacterium]
MQPAASTLSEISTAIQQGRLPAAEQLARDELRAHPGDESILTLLGLSVQLQGRPGDAAVYFEELTRLHPDAALHWNNLGSVLREAGRSEPAEAAYRRAQALAPRDSQILENLGLLYYDRADYAAARVCFVGASELDPASTTARIYGAHACCECTDMASAEHLVAPWWQWSNIEFEQQLLLASVMIRLSHVDTAETILRRALPHAPDKARVTVRLLMLCERLNRVDEARALLAQLPSPASVGDADLQSEIINAHAAMAARENDYQKARDLLERLVGIGTPGSEFFFALARIRDKLGDVDGAMQALDKAHALQMQKASLMIPELIASGAEPLTMGLDPISAESRRQWIDMPAPSVDESPIFIMGFPRSGTTMLEQMLDAVPGLRAMDEQPFLQNVVERIEQFGLSYPRDLHRLDAAQCDELRKVYWGLVRKTVKLEPGQRLVDKNPLNMLRLPLVNRLFPRSRIIFAMRHPCDVVLSNYMQSFGAPAFMLLCSTLERLTRGYVNAMQGWLHHVALLEPALFSLRHEDLLADFAGTAQRIGDFIGVADATPMLTFHEHAKQKGYIATPSYAQVTEPVNRKGVDRWRRYRKHLEPILPALRPVLEHWHYAD